MNPHFTPPDCVVTDVQRALEEDIRTGDLTALLIDAKQQAHGASLHASLRFYVGNRGLTRHFVKWSTTYN